MDKIKSAFDLAMEKTKHLKDVKKAEENIEYKQYVNAASSLARSFLKGRIERIKVIEALRRYPEDAQEKAADIFLEKVISGITLDTCREISEIILALKGDNDKIVKACTDLVDLCEQYIQNLNFKKKEMQKSLTKMQIKKLQREGISGTAIDSFNIDKLNQWKAVSSQIEQEFAGIAQKFKNIY